MTCVNGMHMSVCMSSIYLSPVFYLYVYLPSISFGVGGMCRGSQYAMPCKFNNYLRLLQGRFTRDAVPVRTTTRPQPAMHDLCDN